jgi:hypothetical protein
MLTLAEALAQLFPLVAIDTAQVAWGARTQAGRRGGDQPHFAAQHGCRRGGLAPCRPTLVVALGAEQLLELVVRARQVRHGVAVEQSGTVAAGDLEEVVDGGRQGASPITVPAHGANQPVETALDHGGPLILMVAEHVGGCVHPGVGALDVGPERRRALQPAADQLAQAGKRRRTAPFLVTRSRLSATFSSRALSFSPGAASGARPSSVMALRTAAQ